MALLEVSQIDVHRGRSVIGAFVDGKEWKPHACHTYLHVGTPAEEASTYVDMDAKIARTSSSESRRR